MNFKKTASLSLSLLTFFSFFDVCGQTKSISQNGYEITLITKNLEGKKIVMYYNYGVNKSVYYTDTLVIKSNKFIGKISKKQKVKGAIYSLAFIEKPNEAIQLAIDNNSKIDLVLSYPIIDSLKCTKSSINITFLKYQKTPNIDTKSKLAIIEDVDKNYPNSILQMYMKLEKSMIQKYPENLKDPTIFRQLFLKDINLGDKRIPFAPNLYRFINTMVSSISLNSNSYNGSMDAIMKNLDCSNPSYKTIIDWFISNLAFNESKNLEKSFQHLFKNYINIKKCTIFDPATMAGLRNKNEGIEKLPYLSQIPEFDMIDKNNLSYKLSDIYPKYDFTLIVFYSPECSHCKENVPKNKQMLDYIQAKYPAKKIKIVTVLNDKEQIKWNEFIEKAKIENWLNLKESKPTLEFQARFNTFSNPNYFFINEEGKILLKGFNPKAIEDYLNLK